MATKKPKHRSSSSREAAPAPPVPIERPEDREPILSPEGLAIARQLETVTAMRAVHEAAALDAPSASGTAMRAVHQNWAGDAPGALTGYTSNQSQIGPAGPLADSPAPDPDALAVALRERLVRHALDSMAARLLPKALQTLDRILDGTHPDSRGGAQAVRYVFEPLRMTGAHILDRDRTAGADALTVGELEQEIARASAALRRKLEPSVVSTVPASSSSPEPRADQGGNTA
jgi:hypothetical protein